MLTPSLRSTRVRADWLRPLYEAAKRLDVDRFEPNSLRGFRLKHGRRYRNVLLARGRILPHTDPDFDPWGYALVLRTGNGTEFHVSGLDPLILRRGMLVEFVFHRRHSVRQGRDDLFVWLPWGEPEAARWTTVLERIRRDRTIYQST